jgi:hypothetical protein
MKKYRIEQVNSRFLRQALALVKKFYPYNYQ